MGTAFQSAAGVATPVALAAVAVIATMYGLARYWRYRERQLLAIPEADRAATIEDWLRRLGYDLKNLTKAQKVDLAIRVMDRRQMQFYFAGSTLLVLIVFLGCSGLIGYLVGPLSAGKSDSETNNVALVFGLVARGTVLLIGVGMIAGGLLSGQRSDNAARSNTAKLLFRAVLVVVGAIVVLFTVIRPFEFRSKDTVLIMAPPEIDREIRSVRAKLERIRQQVWETAQARKEAIEVAVVADLVFGAGGPTLSIVPVADHRQRVLNEERQDVELQLQKLEQDLVVSKRHYGVR